MAVYFLAGAGVTGRGVEDFAGSAAAMATRGHVLSIQV
jgi:hypothetical protein